MDIVKELSERDIELTKELEAMLPDALKVYSRIYGKPENVASFHGTIGGKNNTYVDSVREQFQDPKEFIARWVGGLLERVKSIEADQRAKYNGNVYPNSSGHFVIKLLKDETTRRYITIFLTRNFYRNFVERTRRKPDEQLWQIWFGGAELFWGLIISPAYRDSTWTNDKSEMRRAGYSYWTVGHVLETGLIDPSSADPLSFHELKDLLVFYRSILKRVSNSVYEKQVADFYCEYLEKSANPLGEPFLIPELRYAGKEKKHEYRLDYSILNPYTMEMTGFEISPASTHMRIKTKGTKTLKQMNEEVSAQWTKESDKRNKYFASFGISTITFTDKHLKDMGACCSTVAEYLSRRPAVYKSLADVMDEVENFKL